MIPVALRRIRASSELNAGDSGEYIGETRRYNPQSRAFRCIAIVGVRELRHVPPIRRCLECSVYEGTQKALGERFAFTGGIDTFDNVWTECPGYRADLIGLLKP